MDDTVDGTRKRVFAAARTALEPTPHGRRLRQRSIAFTGLVLLVLGFLAAGGVVVLALALRRHDLASRVARAAPVVKSAFRASRHALTSAAGIARQRSEEVWRKRLASTRGGRASNPRREAARLNARGTDLRRKGDPEGAIAAHMASGRKSCC